MEVCFNYDKFFSRRQTNETDDYETDDEDDDETDNEDDDEIIMKHNSGVPVGLDNGAHMSNQCFWISLLDGLKLLKKEIFSNMNVSDLKNYMIYRVIPIGVNCFNDNHEQLSIFNPGDPEKERNTSVKLNNFANDNSILIRIWFRIGNKLDGYLDFGDVDNAEHYQKIYIQYAGIDSTGHYELITRVGSLNYNIRDSDEENGENEDDKLYIYSDEGITKHITKQEITPDFIKKQEELLEHYKSKMKTQMQL